MQRFLDSIPLNVRRILHLGLKFQVLFPRDFQRRFDCFQRLLKVATKMQNIGN